MRDTGKQLGLAAGLQAMISAGDGLAQIALASRVYQQTHAAWAVASVFLAITVPIVLLAPLAGLLLDRLPAKPVLTGAAIVTTGVALALIAVQNVPGTLILAAGFGVCAAVLQPGLSTIVPMLVPPDRITAANGYLQAATWGGMTAGPLLAGLLSAAGGTRLALAGNAACYALGAFGLVLLRLDRAPRPETDEPMLAQLRAGLSYLRADRIARLLVSVVGVMVAFGYMAVVAEVVLAEGVADGVEVLATRSYLNHNAPVAVAGRVFALYSAVMFGAASVGMAAASGLLGPLGARAILIVAGAGGVLAGATGWVLLTVRRSAA